MNPIKVVIIEDEPLAVDRLKKQLQKLDIKTEVVAVLESVKQSINWFLSNPNPELILSDIQLGDGLSFQVFEQNLVTCPIIFTTSYDEFAIRAFKVQSIDYLLKPVKLEELNHALEKFDSQRLAAQTPWIEIQDKIAKMMHQIGGSSSGFKERFVVRQADQLIPVATSEVAYFFTKNDWVCLTTETGNQYLIDFKLEELSEVLDPKYFFRLNRQFIASVSSIIKAHNHLNGKLKLDLVPLPPEEVFVSREKAQAFRSWWEMG